MKKVYVITCEHNQNGVNVIDFISSIYTNKKLAETRTEYLNLAMKDCLTEGQFYRMRTENVLNLNYTEELLNLKIKDLPY